jgi:hypothetical protein
MTWDKKGEKMPVMPTPKEVKTMGRMAGRANRVATGEIGDTISK